MRAEPTVYHVFGFRVRSELALPELRTVDDAGNAEVSVLLGDASRPAGTTTIVEGVAADARHFWMDVPDVARILVRSGREMAVEPAPGADPLSVRAFVLGSAMGALLHQRGLLPLHASAVRIGRGAVAFMGTSGAGKSTIALHLADRGHALLSDDICALEFGDDGVRLHPGPRRMKLWGGSLAATGRDAVGLSRVLPTLEKYQLPLPPEDADPVALTALVLLDRGEITEVARMAGAEAAQALIANTFRGELIPAMARGRDHFEQCVALARHPGVVRLRREWSLDRLDRASAAIERWMATEN